MNVAVSSKLQTDGNGGLGGAIGFDPNVDICKPIAPLKYFWYQSNLGYIISIADIEYIRCVTSPPMAFTNASICR